MTRLVFQETHSSAGSLSEGLDSPQGRLWALANWVWAPPPRPKAPQRQTVSQWAENKFNATGSKHEQRVHVICATCRRWARAMLCGSRQPEAHEPRGQHEEGHQPGTAAPHVACAPAFSVIICFGLIELWRVSITQGPHAASHVEERCGLQKNE